MSAFKVAWRYCFIWMKLYEHFTFMDSIIPSYTSKIFLSKIFDFSCTAWFYRSLLEAFFAVSQHKFFYVTFANSIEHFFNCYRWFYWMSSHFHAFLPMFIYCTVMMMMRVSEKKQISIVPTEHATKKIC